MKKLIFLFVGCLVAQGSVNAMNFGADYYWSVLDKAIKSGKISADTFMGILRLSGYHVNQPDVNGSFLLRHAAYHGRKEIVEALLAAGAHVDQEDHDHSTALHFAAFKGHCDVAQALIAHGADVNHRNNWGAVPLRAAASGATSCHEPILPIAQVLIGAGADVRNMPLGWEEQYPELFNLIQRLNAHRSVARKQTSALLCAGHHHCGVASPAHTVFHADSNVARIMAQFICQGAYENALYGHDQ